VTDEGFDDYVDEDSVTDFVAEDVDTGSDGEWTRPAATGVASVDAAIEGLTRLDELPTSEHVAVYEGLYRQLQDALADLDGS
jgi:hypothetical protein